MIYDIKLSRSGWIRGIDAKSRKEATEIALEKLIAMSKTDINSVFETNPKDFVVEDICENEESIKKVSIIPGKYEDDLFDIFYDNEIPFETDQDGEIVVDRETFDVVSDMAKQKGIVFIPQKFFSRRSLVLVCDDVDSSERG